MGRGSSRVIEGAGVGGVLDYSQVTEVVVSDYKMKKVHVWFVCSKSVGDKMPCVSVCVGCHISVCRVPPQRYSVYSSSLY